MEVKTTIYPLEIAQVFLYTKIVHKLKRKLGVERVVSYLVYIDIDHMFGRAFYIFDSAKSTKALYVKSLSAETLEPARYPITGIFLVPNGMNKLSDFTNKDVLPVILISVLTIDRDVALSSSIKPPEPSV